jgi:hypothetical protein
MRKLANNPPDEGDVTSILRRLKILDHNLKRLLLRNKEDFRSSGLKQTITPLLKQCIKNMPIKPIETDKDLRNAYVKAFIIVLYGNVRKLLE